MNTKVSFFSFFFLTGLVLFLLFSGIHAADKPPAHALRVQAAVGKRLHSHPRILNRFQRDRIRSYLAGSAESSAFVALDTLRLIALQVQFADSLMGGQEGSRRPEVRDSLFFANELQHLTDYFLGASRNNLTIVWEIASPLYTLPEKMGYYGGDGMEEIRVIEMAQTAIDSADDLVDFSRYDALVMIHAGAGQETDLTDDSREQLWSSFYDLDDIDFAFPDSSVYGLATNDSLDGEPFLVDNFLVFPANASQDGNIVGSLSIWAFETGSRIGLLPLFDSSPAGFSDSRGVGSFCLMSYGLFNALGFIPGFPCVFNRVLAGWVDPVFVEEAGHFRLRDINSPVSGDTACLKIPITESEYFLVVNRVHDTNFDELFTFEDFDSNLVPDNTDSLGGAEFDFFLTDVTNPYVVKPDPNFGGLLRRFVSTGSGIYIWHIDEAVIREAVDTGFLPNDFVSRKGVDLEEADGVQDLDGVADQSFSFGSHWDSYRDGHMNRFAHNTDPSSDAYSGARTGIVVSGITTPAPYMECDVNFVLPYDEARVRWEAPSPGQPPTPVNLDGGDSTEIVVLSDTGQVYVFRADGREYRDTDPQVIEPFLSVPGAVWTGPPAFGRLDCDLDWEIVASGTDGRLFAWKGDGSELVDGDGNPLTQGVLYAGLPFAAPPMILDFDADVCPGDKVAIVEKKADSLYVSFIDDTGSKVAPAGFPSIWPIGIHAQFASSPAFGNFGSTGGLVIAWLDTVESVYGISYAAVRPSPVTARSAGVGQQADDPEWSVSLPFAAEIEAGVTFLSPPAVGDLDADNFDEVILTLPNNKLVIYSRGAVGQAGRKPVNTIDLRGNNPSAPAIGDADKDGSLEVALTDDDYFYLYKHNGALCTNWPKPKQVVEYLDLPPLPTENQRRSPLIGDIDDDGRIEILFSEMDGAVYGFRYDGSEVEGFPRTVPAGLGSTPTIFDIEGSNGLSLLTVGSIAPLLGRDAVLDSLATGDLTVLSIQSLSGSNTNDFFWRMHRGDEKRLGHTIALYPLQQESSLAEGGSFIIYPNPVSGGEVHVRIVLNRSADVNIEIYNLEGEKALSREFMGNQGNIVQTPFDRVLDVSKLKSGVYFLRLHLGGTGGSSTFVKTFAIKR